MKSTSSSKAIVSVKNLNFYFPLNMYDGGSSVRDLFITAVRSPLEFLLQKKEFMHVLNDINLEVNEGDRVGIIGINGAGKTTLCRCIAGILRPEHGSVETRGVIRSVFNTNIGVIPELTGKENGFLLAKFIFPYLDRKELEELVDEAIEFSELEKFIDIPFKNYSKGMQARLCLSIISARPADLLILDEVLDGADQFFRAKIKERMLSIITSSKALLFVSHNTEQIREICNRLIILDGNKVLFDGKVDKGIHIYNFMGKK